ncbi:jg25018, partial [Pararge aegeria aegeria]
MLLGLPRYCSASEMFAMAHTDDFFAIRRNRIASLMKRTWGCLDAEILISCQGYLIILVRSEFMKLKNNSPFQFLNNAAEEEGNVNIDFGDETEDIVT